MCVIWLISQLKQWILNFKSIGLSWKAAEFWNPSTTWFLKKRVLFICWIICWSRCSTQNWASLFVWSSKNLWKKTVEAFFNSPMGTISCKFSDEEYMQYMDALITQLNVFAMGSSGWVVKTLSRLEIKTICCNNVTCNSYIETPALLKPLKRFLLNVVNKRDNFCFFHCIVSTRGSC